MSEATESDPFGTPIAAIMRSVQEVIPLCITQPMTQNQWDEMFAPMPDHSDSERASTARRVYGVGCIRRVSALSVIGPYLNGAYKAEQLYRAIAPLLASGARVVVSLEEVQFNSAALEVLFGFIRIAPDPIQSALRERRLNISLRFTLATVVDRHECYHLVRHALLTSDSLTKDIEKWRGRKSVMDLTSLFMIRWMSHQQFKAKEARKPKRRLEGLLEQIRQLHEKSETPAGVLP
jgi:hypothetical protein